MSEQINLLLNNYLQQFDTLSKLKIRESEILYFGTKIINKKEIKDLEIIQCPPKPLWDQSTLTSLSPFKIGASFESLFIQFGNNDAFVIGPHKDCINQIIIMNTLNQKTKIAKINFKVELKTFETNVDEN